MNHMVEFNGLGKIKVSVLYLVNIAIWLNLNLIGKFKYKAKGIVSCFNW